MTLQKPAGADYRRITPILMVLLQSLLVAANLVVSRGLLSELPPLVFRLLQFSLSLLILLAIPLFRRELHLPKDPGLWLRAGFYGFIDTVVPLTAMILGMQYVSSGVMSLLLTLNPVGIILLAHFFLPDERLSLRKGVGMLFAFCGAGLVLMRGESGLADVLLADPRGYLWGLAAVLSLSVSVVFARKYLKTRASYDVTAIRMVSSTSIMLLIVLFSGRFDLSGLTLPGGGAVVFTAFAQVFVFWLSFVVVQRYGATVASQPGYITPIFTLALGTLFLGERVTLTILGGIALVFIGLRILNSKR